MTTTSNGASAVASKPPSTSTNVTRSEHETVSADAHSKIARAPTLSGADADKIARALTISGADADKIARALTISGYHRPRAGQVVSSAAAPEAEDGASGSCGGALRAEVDAPRGQELDRQPARADRRGLGHRRAGPHASDRVGRA